MKKKLFLAVIMAVAMMICAAVSVSAAAVAKIGDQEFPNMGAAIAKANELHLANGEPVTITMVANTTMYGQQNINGNVTITGNYTITRGADVTLFSIGNPDASLTLDGGVILDGGNNWTFLNDDFNAHLETAPNAGGSYSQAEVGGLVATKPLIGCAGNLVIKNATIQNNYVNGKMLIDLQNATISLKSGAKIQHNYVFNDALITNANGTFEGGAKLMNNHAEGTYASLFTVNGKLELRGGSQISGNTVSNGGGVLIPVLPGSELKLSGGKITGNSAFSPFENSDEAMFMMLDGSKFTMNGGEISGNKTRKGLMFDNINAMYTLQSGMIRFVSGTGDRLMNVGDLTVGGGMRIIGEIGKFVFVEGALVNNGKIDAEVQIWADGTTFTGNGEFAKRVHVLPGKSLTINAGKYSDITVCDGSDVIFNDGEVKDGIEIKKDATMTIKKGTFDCHLDVNTDATLTISGGTFESDVSEYCTTGLTAIYHNGRYVIAEPGSILSTITLVLYDNESDTIDGINGKTIAETEIADPTRDGWKFLGWFTDAELTTALDETTVIVGDMTLYAAWEELPKPTPSAAGTWFMIIVRLKPELLG